MTLSQVNYKQRNPCFTDWSKAGKIIRQRRDNMKLTEVEPICESYVELLSRDDLSKIVEHPLLEACQCLYDKKIRTLMTSANRYNVIGLEKLNQSVRKCYAYGEGYAWMWIDYSSLSDQNKELVQSWYQQETEPEPQKRRFLCTISASPECWDFDSFLIENQVQLNTPNYSDSGFIMRYPVNEETTVEEVQAYFNNLARAFYPQYEMHQEGPRRSLKELCEHFKPYLDAMNWNMEEMPLDPTFHSYHITIDAKGKYHNVHDATLERIVLLLSVLESNHLLSENSIPENIRFVEEEKSIKGLKRMTFTLEGRPYQFAIKEKEPDIPNLQFGTSDNLEDLKRDAFLLEHLSQLDWDENLKPATIRIQYRLRQENHS